MSFCRFFIKNLIFIMLPFVLLSSCNKRVSTSIPTLEDSADENTQPFIEEEAVEPVLLPEADIETEEIVEEDISSQVEVPELIKIEDPKERFSLKNIHFEYNKYRLSVTARKILESNAKHLISNPNVYVKIEGHCDERGTEEFNLALGEKRALATRKYLSILGVSPSRLDWVTLGEEMPADTRHNEQAWAENRRAQFKIISR